MKKIISSILLMTMMIMMPYSVMAQTTDVGVKITGSVSIEVITTISADITLDLSTGETTPTYMEIENKSIVPVEAKITDISTSSPGAPSTFVAARPEIYWNSLSQEDTEKYVNFNITGSGQNVAANDILASQTLELGRLNYYYEDNFDKILDESGAGVLGNTRNYKKIYEINANFGKNWSEGDKNFTYQITTVYSRAANYVDNDFKLGISNAELYQSGRLFVLDSIIEDFYEVEFNDPTKDYLTLEVFFTNLDLGGSDLEYDISDYTEPLINYLSVKVNGVKLLYKSNSTFGVGADDQNGNSANVVYIYEMDALSEETSPNYLRVDVTSGIDTYTWFVKTTKSN